MDLIYDEGKLTIHKDCDALDIKSRDFTDEEFALLLQEMPNMTLSLDRIKLKESISIDRFRLLMDKLTEEKIYSRELNLLHLHYGELDGNKIDIIIDGINKGLRIHDLDLGFHELSEMHALRLKAAIIGSGVQSVRVHEDSSHFFKDLKNKNGEKIYLYISGQ